MVVGRLSRQFAEDRALFVPSCMPPVSVPHLRRISNLLSMSQ